MDKYIAELNNVASAMELAYGYGTESIDNIVDAAIKRAESMTDDEKKDVSRQVSRASILLAYATSRMDFYGKRKLDFSIVPCIQEVARVLLKFMKKQQINKETLAELDRCIVAIAVMEERDEEIKIQMPYRFIVLFIVSVCYGFLCSASVIAKFILDQIVMGVNYDS